MHHLQHVTTCQQQLIVRQRMEATKPAWQCGNQVTAQDPATSTDSYSQPGTAWDCQVRLAVPLGRSKMLRSKGCTPGAEPLPGVRTTAANNGRASSGALPTTRRQMNLVQKCGPGRCDKCNGWHPDVKRYKEAPNHLFCTLQCAREWLRQSLLGPNWDQER